MDLGTFARSVLTAINEQAARNAELQKQMQEAEAKLQKLEAELATMRANPAMQ